MSRHLLLSEKLAARNFLSEEALFPAKTPPARRRPARKFVLSPPEPRASHCLPHPERCTFSRRTYPRRLPLLAATCPEAFPPQIAPGAPSSTGRAPFAECSATRLPPRASASPLNPRPCLFTRNLVPNLAPSLPQRPRFLPPSKNFLFLLMFCESYINSSPTNDKNNAHSSPVCPASKTRQTDCPPDFYRHSAPQRLSLPGAHLVMKKPSPSICYLSPLAFTLP